MKRILFYLLLVLSLNVFAQPLKPTGAVIVQTSTFYRTATDSVLHLNLGTVLGFYSFRMRGDTTKLHTGVATLYRLSKYIAIKDTTQNRYGYIPFYRYQFLMLKNDSSKYYEKLANKSTNITTDGASDVKYPSAKAVKTYADGKEPVLGNPGTTGWMLSSTTAGVRSWIAPPSSMIYPATVGLAYFNGTTWGTSITDASGNWNTAYDDRLKWNGGALAGGGTQSAARGNLGVNNTWAVVNSDVQTLAVSAGASAWNMNSGINAKITLTGNVTITLSNVSVNGTWGTLTVYNDATARVITVAGYTNKIDPAIRAGASQFSTSGGSKEDVFGWYWNGTSLSWFGKLDIN